MTGAGGFDTRAERMKDSMVGLISRRRDPHNPVTYSYSSVRTLVCQCVKLGRLGMTDALRFTWMKYDTANGKMPMMGM
jgi:hypothetical protein